MKKMFARIVAIVACLLVSVVCFTACNETKDPYVGTYKIQTVTYAGTTYEHGDAVSFLGISSLTADSMTVTLNADGTASSSNGGNQSSGDTWKKHETLANTVVYTSNTPYGSNDMNVTIVDGVMTMSASTPDGDISYVLNKA